MEGPLDVAEIIQNFEKEGALPAEIGRDPIAFVRELHDAWVREGGVIGGKSRNSLRRLREILAESGDAIPSIQPKMAGQTRLTKGDTSLLVKAILSHWNHVDDHDSSDPGKVIWKQMEGVDVESFIDLLLKEIFEKNKIKKGFLLPHKETNKKPDTSKILEPAENLVGRLVENTDFWITVSAQRTIIASSPSSGVYYFNRMMDKFWKIDINKNGCLTPIWITSVGGRQFEEYDSIAEFINFDLLATAFRILSIFDAESARARWQWFLNRAIFVVGGLQLDEIDNVYKGAGLQIPALSSIRPWMDAGQIQLRQIPDKWTLLNQLKSLYGANLEMIDRRTFLVIGHRGPTDENTMPLNELRYFALGPDAESRDRSNPKRKSVARAMELPSPEDRYDEAFLNICAASYFRLDRQAPGTIAEIDPADALASLRHLGFGVLKLNEFLVLNQQLTAKFQKEPRKA